MNAKQRFFSPPLTEDDTRAKVIFLVGGLCQQLSTIRRITLLTKKASDGIFLENLFTNTALIKQIGKGAKFPGTAVNMVHYYLGNYIAPEDEILVTLGLASDDLLRLEFGNKNKGVVVVLWLPGQADKWAKITGAYSLATGDVAAQFPSLDCLLEMALLNINGIRKEATLHDSDHDVVKSVFMALKENNIYPEQDMVEAHLFRALSWPKYAIDPVLDILSAVKEGKRIKGKVNGTKERFKRWQQECQETQIVKK